MTLFELTLINYLRSSEIAINITGFDMEGFKNTMHQELKHRLDTIEYITFEDEDIMSDSEKITSIKNLFISNESA